MCFIFLHLPCAKSCGKLRKSVCAFSWWHVGALEMLAMEMKAAGMYVSRGLSFREAEVRICMCGNVAGTWICSCISNRLNILYYVLHHKNMFAKKCFRQGPGLQACWVPKSTIEAKNNINISHAVPLPWGGGPNWKFWVPPQKLSGRPWFSGALCDIIRETVLLDICQLLSLVFDGTSFAFWWTGCCLWQSCSFMVQDFAYFFTIRYH